MFVKRAVAILGMRLACGGKVMARYSLSPGVDGCVCMVLIAVSAERMLR